MIQQVVSGEPFKTVPMPPPAPLDGELKAWAEYVGRELRRRRIGANLTQVQLDG